MIFTRTDQGLSNLRLFKDVDLVVFSEGGGPTSLSVKDVISGKYFKSSDDIDFWQPIFSLFRPDLTFSFRAVGAKNTLKDIANRLAHGLVSGICVVMDRDFDDLFGQQIMHHRVVYTHKYSWESELFETRVILHAFQSIALSSVSDRNLEKQIRPVVSSILRELRHFVRADVILSAAGRPLFPRSGSIGALRNRRRLRPPALDRQFIMRRLSDHHSEVRGFFLIRPPKTVSIRKRCFGKVLLAAATHTIRYLCEWQKQPSMANLYCKKFLIRGFHTWLVERPGSIPARYYSRVVSAI